MFSKVVFPLLSILTFNNQVDAQDSSCRLRPRPDINKMSVEALNKYIDGVKQLNSGNKPTKWDVLVKKHIDYYKQAHDDPMFMAWNRRYLADVEAELRNIDPVIRIPYWDWTVYYDNIMSDPVWNIFGGESNSTDYCIHYGTFSNFTVYYDYKAKTYDQGRCYTRKKNFDDVISTPKFLIHQYLDMESEESFWEYMEYGANALVHNGIGRDFAIYASPNDPLFFAHHAFLDKLWFARQNRNPNTTLSYPVKLSTTIPGYNEQIWQILDPMTNYCYLYTPDEYSEKPQMKSVVMSSISCSKQYKTPKPLSKEYINNASLTEERIRRIEHLRELAIKQENKRLCV